MSLIQAFMPRWRLRQIEHVAVVAEPVRTYQIVRAVDIGHLALSRRLFALRVLPERIAAWYRGTAPPAPPAATIDQITAPGTGFHLLADGHHEVVVGSIGRFWEPTIEFADVVPETFMVYDDRGWGKLAYSLSVAPRNGGSWITFDLRVDAGDDASWAKFRRYWRLIGRFSRAIRRALLRDLQHDLGAAPPDDEVYLAGDELLPDARAQVTHSIDIEAPPEKVWPWLVQVGSPRAILPATPGGAEGFEVVQQDPGRALILRGATSLHDGTWAFALEPIGLDATHLVTRYRAAYEPGARTTLLRPVITPLHAFMERKQLRAIKERVEASR